MTKQQARRERQLIEAEDTNLPQTLSIGSGSPEIGARDHSLCDGWQIVARVVGGGYPTGIGWSPHSAALARRLIAAYNACAGIRTEALERGLVTSAIEIATAEQAQAS